MPTLIHLSDLHFGPAYDPRLGEAILKEITTLNPNVVVVSGDFTMRARHREYEAARDFMARMSKPVLTIPGNHDQPVHNPVERLVRQYARYQKYIHPDRDTTLAADGLFIVGLNDNHPFLPGGLWSVRQRAWLKEQLASAPSGAVKVVVSHHQFMWGGQWRPAGFWFPSRTLEMLAHQGVELVLNGHTHIPVVEQTSQGIVVARAGTATSVRTRHGNGNSYNLITIDEKQISVFVRRFDEPSQTFVAARAFSFPRRYA